MSVGTLKVSVDTLKLSVDTLKLSVGMKSGSCQLVATRN